VIYDGREINSQQDLSDLSHDYGLAFSFDPQVEQQSDGSWNAWYPGQDSVVTAEGREAALAALHKWSIDTMDDRSTRDWQVKAVREHLQNGPVPGVYVLDEKRHQRYRESGFSKAEWEKIVAEMKESGE
jgi:hypothetical protein